jgi:hypothetical protein
MIRLLFASLMLLWLTAPAYTDTPNPTKDSRASIADVTGWELPP